MAVFNSILVSTYKYLRDNDLLALDYLFEISTGRAVGRKTVNRFGRNPNMTSGEWDAVWNGGANYTGFDAVNAEIVSVVSSNSGDILGGGGVSRIEVFGLNENYLEQSEIIELNGTTPVLSTKSYIRLDSAKCLGDGTLADMRVNLGEITIRQSITTANVFATIPVGYCATMIACYTVPANKVAYITSQGVSISKNHTASIDARIRTREYGGIFQVKGESAVNTTGTAYLKRDFTTYPKLKPKTDIMIEGNADQNSSALSGTFDLILEDI